MRGPGSLGAPPPACPSFSLNTKRHVPQKWGFSHRVGSPGAWRGRKKTRSPCGSLPPAARPTRPLPWACLAPCLPGWGTHSNPAPPTAGVSWEAGRPSPGPVPSALGVGPWPVLVTLPLLLQTSRSSARGRPSTTWSCTSWPSTASSSRTSQPWPLPPLLPAPTSAQDSCERTTPRAPGSPACVCGPLDGVSGSLTLRVHHFPAGHHFGAPPALLNFQSH